MRANRGIGLVVFALLACTALAVSLASCGGTADSSSASRSTEVVEAAGLRFGVSSRFLDPNNDRDATYLAGQPSPGAGERWAGVFLELENEGGQPTDLPAISLTDAAGTVHAAYPPGSNPYLRHFGEVVEPHETQPALDSNGQPAKPSLLLFRLKPSSEKRPFTLHIESEEKEAKIALGL